MNESLSQRQLHSIRDMLRARHSVLAELIHLELTNSGEQIHMELAGLVRDNSEESLLSTLRNADEAIVELHLRELEDIANAEQRIATGTFGRCADCGQGIGYTRLSNYPTAKRCVDCQGLHESR